MDSKSFDKYEQDASSTNDDYGKSNEKANDVCLIPPITTTTPFNDVPQPTSTYLSLSQLSDQLAIAEEKIADYEKITAEQSDLFEKMSLSTMKEVSDLEVTNLHVTSPQCI